MEEREKNLPDGQQPSKTVLQEVAAGDVEEDERKKGEVEEEPGKLQRKRQRTLPRWLSSSQAHPTPKSHQTVDSHNKHKSCLASQLSQYCHTHIS